MPIISEKELELSVSNSKRYKSNSEDSDRHIHEPIQAVLHHVQGQVLGNVLTKPPRSDELWAHLEKAPQRGGNREILQWMESTIIQTSNQKYKGLAQQEKGARKEEAPVASTSKPPASQPPCKV
ncbi:hypothetical protein O181_133122 [Austropuccinia psidii MF-1]|uniref:Uncharacterized protein n=1 Tax=Austropuccinia psidii MF-1 TaxID=1389203 RepID=A0A9Q3QEA1_9BASI|nr:hypothetical protein [Austropuccinia psidii MF-1]